MGLCRPVLAALLPSLQNAWYQGRTWPLVLLPLTGLYRLGRRLHRAANGARANPLPLLVVGNITVGGTGKTPLVASLVQALVQAGLRPAIISRGYGARLPQSRLVTAADSAAEVGDEPLLLHRLTGVPVMVGPKRHESLAALAQGGDIDLVVADDGLQHPGLKGDLEWLLLDGQRGLGNGHCLPAGPLREPVTRLQRVHQVLVSGAPSQALEATLNTLGVAYQQLEPSWAGLRRVDDHSPASWPDTHAPLRALAGLGDPQRFFDQLAARGYRGDFLAFADHHPYSAKDLPWDDPIPVIMTAKDAVKCQPLAAGGCPPWYYVEQQLALPDALLRQAQGLVKRAPEPSLGADNG